MIVANKLLGYVTTMIIRISFSGRLLTAYHNAELVLINSLPTWITGSRPL